VPGTFASKSSAEISPAPLSTRLKSAGHLFCPHEQVHPGGGGGGLAGAQGERRLDVIAVPCYNRVLDLFRVQRRGTVPLLGKGVNPTRGLSHDAQEDVASRSWLSYAGIERAHKLMRRPVVLGGGLQALARRLSCARWTWLWDVLVPQPVQINTRGVARTRRRSRPWAVASPRPFLCPSSKEGSA